MGQLGGGQLGGDAPRAGGGGGGVTSVNGDTGPAVVLDASAVGADSAGTATAAVGAHEADATAHPASSITATGVLGSDVQTQLTALYNAAVTDTVLTVDPYTITASGTWNTLVALPIANASTRNLYAVVEFSSGPNTAPQVASISLKGVAVRNAAGTITASSLSITTDSLVLSGVQARLDVGVGVVNLQFRKTGSATAVRAVLRYSWRESLVP